MASSSLGSDRGERIRRLVLVALLALAAAVGVARAVDGILDGWRPTAPGERRWLEWAFGNPWERAVRRALPEEPGAASGSGGARELVLRVIAGGPVRADWVQVMAQYRWPAHRVLGVEVAAGGRSGRPSAEPRSAGGIEIRVSAPAPAPRWSGRSGGVAGDPVFLVVGFLVGATILASLQRWSSIDPGAVADALAAVFVGLFVWKVAAAPLWSWDHFAIWGLKARRLAAVGLHPDWLAPPAFGYSAPDYPLGWPLLLSSAALLGKVAGSAVFKSVHVACGVGLTLLVRLAVLRSTGDRMVAGTAAVFTAASPLLWDTESLGLADLPLALLAVAALVLGTGEALPTRLRRGCAGLLLGLLPWVKQEGWVLSVLLLGALAVAAVSDPGRRSGGRLKAPKPLLALAATLGLPCGFLWLSQALFHARFTRPGIGFLAGDWTDRILVRLPEAPTILAALVRDLLHPAWLGLWILFPVALGTVLVRVRGAGPRGGRWTALGLGLAVLAQLGVYTFIYFATYLDPVAHIDSSFLRIAAALAPLAVVSAATAIGARSRSPQRAGAA